MSKFYTFRKQELYDWDLVVVVIMTSSTIFLF